MVLVAHELFEVKRRGVVERLSGRFKQEGFRIHFGFGAPLQLGKDSDLGGLKHTVQAPQDRERQITLPYSDCL